jgi:thymidylate kinase
MLVICIEGAHGCGKTRLVESFKRAGYPVLDEMFMELPAHFSSLDPQSMVRESAWVTHWFERVLRYEREHPDVPVVVSDRSPYSAVIYANRGVQLKDCISTQLEELVTCTSIRVVNVLLEVEETVHWARILERLAREPERAKYNEASKEWMHTVRQRYAALMDVFHGVVDNSEADAIDAAHAKVLTLI